MAHYMYAEHPKITKIKNYRGVCMRGVTKAPGHKWVFNGIKENPYGDTGLLVAEFKLQDGGLKTHLPDTYLLDGNRIRGLMQKRSIIDPNIPVSVLDVGL
jgi:hypothetical protein